MTPRNKPLFSYLFIPFATLFLVAFVAGTLAFPYTGKAGSQTPAWIEAQAAGKPVIFLPVVMGGQPVDSTQQTPAATNQTHPASQTVAPTGTSTPLGNATSTPIGSNTSTPTATAKNTATHTPTATATATNTATHTPTATATATQTPTPTPDPSISFAVVGDFGCGYRDWNCKEGDVAALIDSWNVDFVITVGDNNYPDGSATTLDANVGQFYHSYIYPYQGNYGPGALSNRFFPTLGNRDYFTGNIQPYLDYFTLPETIPGNERYYDFVWGPVHFFALDSDYHEPDGRTQTSKQGKWLQNRLAQSTSPWNVVYFHHAPYSSGAGHGETPEMHWPFKDWGADIVLSGHAHDYERLTFGGLTYVVNGVGGDSLDAFQNPLPYGPGDPVASIVRYNAEYGAMRVVADLSTLSYKFINVSHTVIDSFALAR